MSRDFYGMGEVCLVGSMAADGNSRTASDGGHVCGSDDGESWTVSSLISRVSAAGDDTRRPSSSSIGPEGSDAALCPLSLEVQDLRSRLDIATRLLADKKETIEGLASELTTFKSLYKEAIQEMHSLDSSRRLPCPATPDQPPRLTRTLPAMQHYCVREAPDDDDDDDRSSAAGSSRAPSNSGAASPAGLMRTGQHPRPAPIGRFYSWREGRQRKVSSSSLVLQAQPPLLRS